MRKTDDEVRAVIEIQEGRVEFARHKMWSRAYIQALRWSLGEVPDEAPRFPKGPRKGEARQMDSKAIALHQPRGVFKRSHMVEVVPDCGLDSRPHEHWIYADYVWCRRQPLHGQKEERGK